MWLWISKEVSRVNLRIKYGKTIKGKFLSHLDLIRAWERAMRRGKIPLAFSQGFNPHPKMSFGSALAVGVTSSGEYMDIELKNIFPIQEIKRELEKYLPVGLELYEIVKIDNKAASLMSIINRAKYLVKARLKEPFNQEKFANGIKILLNQENVKILRPTKKGLKEKDIRSGIYELKGRIIDDKTVLVEFIVQTGSSGNIRPEEVMAALEKNGVPLDLKILDIHREGLYIDRGSGLISPLSVTI